MKTINSISWDVILGMVIFALWFYVNTNYDMKKFKRKFKGFLLILLVISFSSCSIRKMCTNYNQPFKIVDYTKSVHVYTVESLNCNCFVSFRMYDTFKIGDTIQFTYVNRTDMIANKINR
jgi:hypothetical protein